LRARVRVNADAEATTSATVAFPVLRGIPGFTALQSLELGENPPDWWRLAVERAHKLAGALAGPAGEDEFRRAVTDAAQSLRRDLQLDPEVAMPRP
jgi:hypothetical protein